MRAFLFLASLAFFHTTTAAENKELAGSESCIDKSSSICDSTSSSTAHYVVTSDLPPIDHKAVKPHHNSDHNETSASSRNAPILPFQFLGFLVQSARGGARTTGYFHHRGAQEKDEVACLTNNTISHTAGEPTSKTLNCDGHIIAQKDGAAHGTAHTVGVPAKGSSNTTEQSSSSRTSPHRVFRFLALMIPSTQARGHIPTISTPTVASSEGFHGRGSNTNTPSDVALTAENADVIETQSWSEDKDNTHRAPDPHPENELPQKSLMEEGTSCAGCPNAQFKKASPLAGTQCRGGIMSLKKRPTGLLGEVRQLRKLHMSGELGEINVSAGWLRPFSDFGSSGYWLVARYLDWRSKLDRVRMLFGI